jgi:UDP-2,3-diacylglucosamine pyrophosphatase LpxH
VTDPIIQDKLNTLFDQTPAQPLSDDSRIIVFSDLHLGNGGGADDFRRNSKLFTEAVRRYYAELGFTLILNGDVEELHRFHLRAVRKRWGSVYSLLADLQDQNRLIKIVGNHDHELFTLPPPSYPLEVVQAVKYRYKGQDIFILHGHQATSYFDKWNTFSGYFLRYVANPLKIKNRTVAHDSDKKFKTELRAYEFSSKRKIITFIGHTHRPLFESHSKIDELKFKIENHLRNHASAELDRRDTIEEEVREYRRELSKLYETHDTVSLQSNLYNQLIVPSLFNSGCVIGKRGITGLEITEGRLSLVHWFDRNISAVHLTKGESEPARIDGTDFYRTVLKSDSLAYIFARIRLLA